MAGVDLTGLDAFDRVLDRLIDAGRNHEAAEETIRSLRDDLTRARADLNASKAEVGSLRSSAARWEPEREKVHTVLVETRDILTKLANEKRAFAVDEPIGFSERLGLAIAATDPIPF